MNEIYTLDEDHIQQLHALYQSEWWSKGRSLDETRKVVSGSQITIGLIDEQNRLQAFARIITDYIFKALVFDVIVAEQQRGGKSGERLIALIKNHPDLKSIKSLELYCLPEMFPFYRKYGFTPDIGEIRLMRCLRE